MEPLQVAGQISFDFGRKSNDSSELADLKQRLSLIETEKADLLQQLQATLEDRTKKQQALLTRYINADYLLAYLEYLLPSKRCNISRPNSGLRSSFFVGSSVASSKSLLEPISNMLYAKMYMSTKDAQARMRQSSDDLVAWKFDPESASGKRLMNRMRQLLNENDLLGQANHAERMKSLETEVEAQTKCIREFVETHEGIDGVLEEAYVDLENLQSNLFMLHQQITDAELLVQTMQAQLEMHKPGRAAELLETVWNEAQKPETDERPKFSPTSFKSVEESAWDKPPSDKSLSKEADSDSTNQV